MRNDHSPLPNPPLWVLNFLRWFCAEEFLEEIEGDLYELFYDYVDEFGERKARKKFFLYLFPYLRPYFWGRRSFSILKIFPTAAMINNYLKIAWRQFIHSGPYSIINILGLTVGMMALLFIVEYVRFEKSYDQFHLKGDQLYRLRAEGWHNDGSMWFRSTANFPVAGPAVKEKVAEVLDFVRIHYSEGIFSPLGKEKEISYKESDICFVDSSFLRMFSFPLIAGNVNSALKDPNSIVLTEEMAQKYFGNTNVIGESIVINFDQPLKVTGVLKKLPKNSHLEFDFLISYYSLTDSQFYESWGWTNFYTYVQLVPGADIEKLHTQFDQILYDQKGDYFENVQAREIWRLQPLDQIHLHSGFNNQAGIDAQANMIYLLFAIGIFVMILAWINFVNISTARAIERGKEVGIRKTIGGTKGQLIIQFLLEAFLINGLALIVALILIKWLAPVFNEFSGQVNHTNIWSLPSFWWISLGIWFIGGLISGLYPAILMGSFKPISVLKGKRQPGGTFSILRKGLVIFQFSMAVALIIGTVAIYRQIQFMRSQELGFRIDQIYTMNGPHAFPIDSTFVDHLRTFRTALMSNSNIKQFTSSQSVPGHGLSSWGGYIRRAEFDGSHARTFDLVGIDDQFLPTFEIELIAGRNFSKDISSDENTVILSETARQRLGFENSEEAIDKLIFYPLNERSDGTKARVIGVAKDHHHYSLRESFQPIIYSFQPASPEYFSVVADNNQLSETVSYIRETWKVHFGAEPMDGFFLDDDFNEAYDADLQFGNICALFSSLAIFIALLGLIGLSTYMTIQRAKEISIRKVLGADVLHIVGLLSSQFIAIVLISGLISIPIAYWGIYEWLEDFPFHMSIHPLLFVVPILVTIAIAWISVSWQTVRSARANPAEILKYE